LTDKDKTQILALRDEAKKGFDKHRTDFQTLESGLLSIIDEGKRTSLKLRRKSTLNPQLIKPKVDSVTRDIMRSFFGQGQLAEIQPESPDDERDVKISEILSMELKDFSRDEKLYFRVKPIIKNALTYGTVVTKVYYDTKSEKVKVEKCRLNEVYLDSKAAGPFDIKYLVHRIDSMTISELKSAYPKHKAKIDWTSYVGDTLEVAKDELEDDDIGDYQRVEIVEVYRLKGKNWYVSTLIGDEFLRDDVLLRDGLPFIVSPVEEQFVLMDETPVRAYGDPFIAPLIPIQEEYVIRRNQTIDAIDLQLNPRIITTPHSGLRDEDLNSNRKKLVVDEMGNFEVLPAPTISEALLDTSLLDQEAEAISGVSKYSQGVSTDQNKSKTKGEAMILDARSSAVVDDLTRAINETFFRPLIVRIINLTYKYKPSGNFAGTDRTKPLRQKIIIDVGMGSSNKEVQIQNVDSAIETITARMGMLQPMGMMPDGATPIPNDRVPMYDAILDELVKEKLKLLGKNSIVETMEEHEKMREEAQSQTQGGINV